MSCKKWDWSIMFKLHSISYKFRKVWIYCFTTIKVKRKYQGRLCSLDLVGNQSRRMVNLSSKVVGCRAGKSISIKSILCIESTTATIVLGEGLV